MRMTRLFATLGLPGVLGLVAAAAPARPAAQPPAGGEARAQPGDEVPGTFRAYVVADDRFPPYEVEKTIDLGGGKKRFEKATVTDPRNRTGRIHCLVCEYGLSPVVAVFARPQALDKGADQRVVDLAVRVNQLIPEYKSEKLSAFVSFLSLAPAAGGNKAGPVGVGDANLSATIPSAEPPAADGKPRPPVAVTVTYGQTGKAVRIEDPGRPADQQVDYGYPDDEERDAKAAAVRQLADAARTAIKAVKSDRPQVLMVPFTVAAARSPAGDDWGLSADAPVTVIYYHRMKVVNRWTFGPAGPTAADVAAIEKAVRSDLGKPIDVPKD